MKNRHSGFIIPFVPIVIGVIVLLLLGLGTFIYFNYNVPKAVIDPEVQSSTQTSVKNAEHKYTYVDYNFDGYTDRSEVLDCGATGNCSSLIEFYNPETKSFPNERKEGDICFVGGIEDNDNCFINPVVNQKEKIMCSYSNSSATSFDFFIYKYKAGSFYPVRYLFVGYDDYSGDHVKSEYTYNDGKLVVQNKTKVPDDFNTAMPECTLIDPQNHI